jgi:2-desacetyl-2-hydroxyethyl bacteriochlorophyllide A dehydrogenase
MTAALFSGGPDIALEQLPMPEPGPGEVLFRVVSTGICGSDLQFYRGERPWNRGSHTEDGHELAGEVVALGPGVAGLVVGQRIGIEPEHLVGCGRCTWCRAGETHLCPLRGKATGVEHRSHGFSQYDVCIAENVHPLPESVSTDAAALLDCYACAVHAVRRAPVHPHSVVAIVGTGAIALTLGQVLLAQGVGTVVVVGTRPETAERAVAAGAAHVGIHPGAGDVIEQVLARTGGRGADVVFETVGGAAGTFGQAVGMARRGGTICVLGVLTEAPDFPAVLAFQKELTVAWSNSYSTWDGVSEYRIALDLLASGALSADPLITHHFPLTDVREAFAVADDRRRTGAVKVLVHP